MRKFGLIGYPLSHSFSRSYFLKKFLEENITDCEYLNFPITEISELPLIISRNQELYGLNVTIPYKEQVIAYLHETDPDAGKVGAVNTIKINRKGNTYFLKGFNTDIYGFTTALEEILTTKPGKALILGTGGASKAIAYSLKKMNISYQFVSRKKGNLTYNDIDKVIINEHKLIINTTPLGMYPDTDSYPDIPYHFLNQEHILFDLVYNPSMTLFLSKGKEQGASISNGLRMLYLQAERSWEIWNS